MLILFLRFVLSTALWHGPAFIGHAVDESKRQGTEHYIQCVKAHHYKHINQCPKGDR